MDQNFSNYEQNVKRRKKTLKLEEKNYSTWEQKTSEKK